MAYFTDSELYQIGFKSIGKNVKISKLASIYDHNKIEIGDNSRIDDFCVISGKINIGSYIHITPMCLLAGGEMGIEIKDFCTFAYGVKIFTQSDDYTGSTLTNSLIPKKYKNEFKAPITIHKHTIVGAGSIIMPGVILNEGTSIGSMSLVLKSTEAWSIYIGIPAKKLRDRNKALLDIEKDFINDTKKSKG